LQSQVALEAFCPFYQPASIQGTYPLMINLPLTVMDLKPWYDVIFIFSHPKHH